jgi:intein/homing endonuclease
MPRDNPSGADNQQGSPTDVEIAWLAGIFDGEGWIGINRSLRYSTGKYRYSAGSVLATTSERLANRISQLLEQLEVKFFYIDTPARKGSDESWRRRKWNISIVGNTQTKKLLLALSPYLVEKYVQADLVLAYIEARGKMPSRPGGYDLAMNQSIRDLGNHFQMLLRDDRNRDDPSETVRLASLVE